MEKLISDAFARCSEMSKRILAVLGFLALELINEDDLIGVFDP